MFFPEKITARFSENILEIGPGGFPSFQSSVLFDRFYNDEDAKKQSWGTGIVTRGKPLVVSKSNNLPFKDKSFQYVICSHVLEHVPCDQIQHFFYEMQRVSKIWYVEFPSIFYEMFFDIPEHENVLFFYENIIYILPKSSIRDFDWYKMQYFNHMRNVLHLDRLFGRWIFLLKRFFFIGSEFNENTTISIVDSLEDIPNKAYPLYKREILRDSINLLSAYVKKTFINKKVSLDISVLECPECKNHVSVNDWVVKCSQCEYSYIIY